MKHIKSFKAIFESKTDELVFELIDDVFLDWIDNKELFSNKKIEIVGYKTNVDDNHTTSRPKIGDLTHYKYNLRLKKSIDVREIENKIKLLNNYNFLVSNYYCTSSNTFSNGDYKEKTNIEIYLTYLKNKVELKQEITDVIDKLKSLGYKEDNSNSPRYWNFEKKIKVNPDIKIDPSWFLKTKLGVKSFYYDKTLNLFIDGYNELKDKEIKKISKKIPEFKNLEQNVHYGRNSHTGIIELEDIIIKFISSMMILQEDNIYVDIDIVIENKNLN
jgi:hypothetical protein